MLWSVCGLSNWQMYITRKLGNQSEEGEEGAMR